MSDGSKQGRTTFGWGVAALPQGSGDRVTVRNGTSAAAKPSPRTPHVDPRPPAGGSAVPPAGGQKK